MNQAWISLSKNQNEQGYIEKGSCYEFIFIFKFAGTSNMTNTTIEDPLLLSNFRDWNEYYKPCKITAFSGKWHLIDNERFKSFICDKCNDNA